MLIGLTGQMQVGKDTVADYLEENYGFTRVAFADKVYECAAVLLGVSVDQLRRWKLDDKISIRIANRSEWTLVSLSEDITIRQFLQYLGTDVGRKILGDMTWIKLLFDKLPTKQEQDPTDYMRYWEIIDGDYVIPDCRFNNEAAKIKRFHNGTVWRIERGPKVTGGHESEAGIADDWVNVVIKNDKKLNDLYTMVDRIMADARANA